MVEDGNVSDSGALADREGDDVDAMGIRAGG
jgi:hypothetical protein